METIRVLMEIIAFGCFSVLCIYLIVVLTRVRELLGQIQHDLKEISAKAIPVFENLEQITDKIKRITANLDEQFLIVRDTVNSFRGIAENVVDFERRVQEQIQEPVFEAISIFTSMIKGIRSFVERVRG